MSKLCFRQLVGWLFLVGCVWSIATIAQAQRTQPATRQLGVILRFEQDASGKVVAVVTEVVRGSAAQSAGVQAGDILLAVSGVNVDSPASIRQLQRLLAEGQPLSFVVSRDGKVMTLGAEGSSSPAPAPSAWLGVKLEQIPPSWGIKGVLVNEVIAGSPAEEAGILSGDIILQVDNTPVDSIKALQQTIGQMSAGQACVVHLQRGERSIQKTVIVRAPSDVRAPLQRLGAINVLKYALIDARNGEVTFIGVYDPRLPGGAIAYDDILRDALASPYPSFSLEPTAETYKVIEQGMKLVDADIERLWRDQQYGILWANRLIGTVLNDPRASIDRQRLAQKLGDAFGITPQEAQIILDASQDKPVDRRQHFQVIAKVMRKIGWDEIAEFILAEGQGGAQQLFQRLGIWQQAEPIIAAYHAGRLSEAQALRELDGLLYPALMRRIGVPEAEVNNILQQFRNGRISSQQLNQITMQKMTHIVSTRFIDKIVNGWTLTPQTLSILYNLPVPKVQPVFTGLDRHSVLGKIFYEADYHLKTLCTSPEIRWGVPAHLTQHEYFDQQAKRTGVRIPGGMGAEAGHQLQPAEVKMRVSPDGSAVAFDTANIRIIGWLRRFIGKDKRAESALKEWIEDYARYLTQHYDQYARVTPEFHRLREAAKVIALVRWAQSSGRKLVPARPLGLRFSLPQEVDGFWTAVFEMGGDAAALNVVFEGGTDFGKHVGDRWVQSAPNAELTGSISRQLAASAVLSSQAAEAATTGDLETARDLAERAARAMTGEIDLTQLPTLQGNIPEIPDPAKHAEALLEALQAIDESVRGLQVARNAAENAQIAADLSEVDRARIKADAQQLQQLASAQITVLQQALRQITQNPSSASQVLPTLRQREPIFIPPTVAHLGAQRGKPAAPAVQTTALDPPAEAESALLKQKWTAELEEVEKRIAVVTKQLSSLSQNALLNAQLFDDWQKLAQEGMDECAKAFLNLWTDTASLGLGRHYKQLAEKASANPQTAKEVLERIQRGRSLLEKLEKVRTLTDALDLVLREKRTLAQVLEAIRDGIGLLADFTPLREHPATLAWKYGSNMVDLVHSFFVYHEVWYGITQLERTNEQYLYRVHQLSDELKALMERAKELRERIASAK
ncbi:MAG: PDZ domain-containing protein [Armatimonadota bacterium]|nr:PDZ domain-containing protein [bacterium]MDW8320983.1 PDZ domain-containing protein [Armatimonadota bacterium]